MEMNSLLSFTARHALIALLPLLASTAWAGSAYIQLSGTPIYKKSDSSTGQTRLGGSFDSEVNAASGLGYDLRGTIGYAFWDQLLIGLNYNRLYSPLKAEPRPDEASGSKQLTKSSELGPSMGWLAGNFHFIGTFFVSGKRSFSDKVLDDGSGMYTTPDESYEHKLKNGFQLDVGYTAPLSRFFALGVSLVYKTTSYKTGTLRNAADPTTNYTDKAFESKPINAELTPLISFVLKF